MGVRPFSAMALVVIGFVFLIFGAMIYNAVWWGLLGIIGTLCMIGGLILMLGGVLFYIVLPLAGYERRPSN